MLIDGTRTTASSLSVTDVPPTEMAFTTAMLVRLSVTVIVFEQVIDSPAASVVFGQVRVKSSPGVPGVPLSSVTTMLFSVFGPVFSTT